MISGTIGQLLLAKNVLKWCVSFVEEAIEGTKDLKTQRAMERDLQATNITIDLLDTLIRITRKAGEDRDS